MFQGGKFQSSLRNSHRREDYGFRCHVMPIINYTIDAYSTVFATYRVKVSENGNLKENEVFQGRQFRNFECGTVTENQGYENSVLVRALFVQSTLQVTQTIIYFT